MPELGDVFPSDLPGFGESNLGGFDEGLQPGDYTPGGFGEGLDPVDPRRNFILLSEASDIAREYAQGFPNRKCFECAANIRKGLVKEGYSGRIIDIQTPDRSFLWHDGIQDTIADNERHRAVEVDGVIYDNINSNGISRSEWESLLQSQSGGFETFKLKETDF